MPNWYKMDCPHCGKGNWVELGNMADCTLPDVEGCECWGCSKKFLLDPRMMMEFYRHEIGEGCRYATLDAFAEEGAYCKKGRERPEDTPEYHGS